MTLNDRINECRSDLDLWKGLAERALRDEDWDQALHFSQRLVLTAAVLASLESLSAQQTGSLLYAGLRSTLDRPSRDTDVAPGPGSSGTQSPPPF